MIIYVCQNLLAFIAYSSYHTAQNITSRSYAIYNVRTSYNLFIKPSVNSKGSRKRVSQKDEIKTVYYCYDRGGKVKRIMR